MQVMMYTVFREILLESMDRLAHFVGPVSIPRKNSEILIDSQKIISLIGPRRSGKTTLLLQTVDALLTRKKNKVSIDRILFINFEDERLADLKAVDLDLLLKAFQGISVAPLHTCYFFFDEIQNAPHWDKFVRRLYDSVTQNIFLTGSNAKALSSEIATSLRGRTLSQEVFPFSFEEYKVLRQKITNRKVPYEVGIRDYLEFGGFPEVIKSENKQIKITLLQEYFRVMMYRDVVERYQINESNLLRLLLRQLVLSAAKAFSVNKIFKTLKSSNISISNTSLYAWVEYCSDAYLIQTLDKYHEKPLLRKIGERKVYFIDNGLLSAMQTQENLGQKLEQAVFLHLRRIKKSDEILFYKDKIECDFLVLDRWKVKGALQVSITLKDPDAKNREIAGLIQACKYFKLKSGTIVTLNEWDEFVMDGIRIVVKPFEQWQEEFCNG